MYCTRKEAGGMLQRQRTIDEIFLLALIYAFKAVQGIIDWLPEQIWPRAPVAKSRRPCRHRGSRNGLLPGA